MMIASAASVGYITTFCSSAWGFPSHTHILGPLLYSQGIRLTLLSGVLLAFSGDQDPEKYQGEGTIAIHSVETISGPVITR